jgi:hypothetical protein
MKKIRDHLGNDIVENDYVILTTVVAMHVCQLSIIGNKSIIFLPLNPGFRFSQFEYTNSEIKNLHAVKIDPKYANWFSLNPERPSGYFDIFGRKLSTGDKVLTYSYWNMIHGNIVSNVSIGSFGEILTGYVTVNTTWGPILRDCQSLYKI